MTPERTAMKLPSILAACLLAASTLSFAQAPSGDTMHVPIGVSGVHAVPKTLHSQGLSTPLSTSPH